MSIFIFAGPSVPRDLRDHYRDVATVLPPVKSGDLLALNAKAGDTVGIIDGFFGRQPAVRHKEILSLIDDGVIVHGAASMGALRAAELADFGMIGHGRIFSDYRSGRVTGDDEVALLHGTDTEDYRPFTEALINVRYALEAGAKVGAVSGEAAETVLSVLARVPYSERTREHLVTVARTAPVLSADLPWIERLVRGAVDAKAVDARLLLRALTRNPTPADVTPWRLNRTLWLRRWHGQVTGDGTPGADWTADDQVHAFCQVIADDYPAFREQAGLRALAVRHAVHLGLLDERPARTAPESTVGDLSEAAMTALSAHVQQTGGPGEADRDDFLRWVCAEHLRHLGLLSAHEGSNPALDGWCTTAERSLAPSIRAGRAAVRALFTPTALMWGDPFIGPLKAHGAYQRARAHIEASRRHHQTIVETRPTFQVEHLREDKIRDHFSRKWGRPDFDDAVAERGFPTAADFIAQARPFYLYDKASTGVPLRILEDA